jgi:hypothetical protein
MGSILEDQNLQGLTSLNAKQQDAYNKTFAIGTAGRDASPRSFVDSWNSGKKYPNAPTELSVMLHSIRGTRAPAIASDSTASDFFSAIDKIGHAGLAPPNAAQFQLKTDATKN